MGKVLDFASKKKYNLPKYPEIDMNDILDAEEQDRKYAEEVLQNLFIPLVEMMGEYGFDMKDQQLHSDMSIVVKFLRPLVYRQLNMYHELHEPLEEIANKDFMFTIYPKDMFSKNDK